MGKQFTRFFSLFNKAIRVGAIHDKDHHALIDSYTGGHTQSLKALTPAELKRIEVYIQELMDPAAAAANRQRRKIIAILASRGASDAAGKPDMKHVYAWVLKYGYLHKPLNHYTNAELPRLVTQAERIVASDIKAMSKSNG